MQTIIELYQNKTYKKRSK